MQRNYFNILDNTQESVYFLDLTIINFAKGFNTLPIAKKTPEVKD